MMYYGCLKLRQSFEWVAIQQKQNAQKQNQQVSQRNKIQKNPANRNSQQRNQTSESEHHGQHTGKHKQAQKIFLPPGFALIAQVRQKAGIKRQNAWTGGGQKAEQQ